MDPDLAKDEQLRRLVLEQQAELCRQVLKLPPRRLVLEVDRTLVAHPVDSFEIVRVPGLQPSMLDLARAFWGPLEILPLEHTFEVCFQVGEHRLERRDLPVENLPLEGPGSIIRRHQHPAEILFGSRGMLAEVEVTRELVFHLAREAEADGLELDGGEVLAHGS
jgi:hypothetical protein